MKHHTEEIGSTDYKYWDRMLADLDDQDLMRGLDGTKDFKGYLTLGDFREMCEKPRSHASHQYFLPEPDYKATPEKIATSASWREKIRETGI